LLHNQRWKRKHVVHSHKLSEFEKNLTSNEILDAESMSSENDVLEMDYFDAGDVAEDFVETQDDDFTSYVAVDQKPFL